MNLLKRLLLKLFKVDRKTYSYDEKLEQHSHKVTCSKCKRPLKSGGKFCSQCGKAKI